MARENRRVAKRANRPNPREDRNNLPNFLISNDGRVRNKPQQVIPTGPKKPVVIIPRNLAQENYVETLHDIEKSIVFAMGPAGTGKTLLATQFAIKQLQEGSIQKIFITRPAVSVDEQHGYLPGTIIDKLAPWVIPVIDVFKEHYTVAAVEKMLKEEVIDIAPLAYMRGRNLKHAICLADEMQNATPSQMKMLLTRIGEGCRMFVTGDLKQHDRGFEQNGLKDFVERLKVIRSRRIAVCEFGVGDVERHPAVEEILRIYGED